MDIKGFQEYTGHVGEKISVIIPVYNREKYIGRCLQSVVSQTFPIDQLEIIVVDDGSTDNTVEIVKEYEKEYEESILLIICDENSGGNPGKPRNIGLSYASGAAVCLIDSDDRMLPNMLELLYTRMILTGAEVVKAGFQAVGRKYGEFHPVEHIYETDKLLEKRALIMQEGMDASLWNKLYRRSFIEENGLRFPEDLPISNDFNFHDEVTLKVKKYYSIPDIVYEYTYNEEGIWNNPRKLEVAQESLKTVLIRSLNIYSSHPEIADELCWKAVGHVLEIKNKWEEMGRDDLVKENIPVYISLIQEQYPNMRQNKYLQDNFDFIFADE